MLASSPPLGPHASGDDQPAVAFAGFCAAEEEEITPETAVALDRARASLARGEGIPHDDILREFGLSK